MEKSYIAPHCDVYITYTHMYINVYDCAHVLAAFDYSRRNVPIAGNNVDTHKSLYWHTKHAQHSTPKLHTIYPVCERKYVETSVLSETKSATATNQEKTVVNSSNISSILMCRMSINQSHCYSCDELFTHSLGFFVVVSLFSAIGWLFEIRTSIASSKKKWKLLQKCIRMKFFSSQLFWW